MNINKKVISIVILGVGACLLSSLFHLYFSIKSENNQRLLFQIQQLTGKAENLRLMSKNFIQSGDPEIWRKITDTIASIQHNLTEVSPAGKGWKEKLGGIHEGLTGYHDLLDRIYDPAILLNREKGKFQRIGLSFSMEVRERIIAPYRREEGLTIYQGKAFDPVKTRIKETAYDLMALHTQQQLILTELLLDWDLAGYRRKKRQIAGETERHRAQLNYLNILMGSEPEIDNIIRSLKQKMDVLVQHEQEILKSFAELDGINRKLAAAGSSLVSECESLSTEILSDISHTVTLNSNLNWALLVIILCGLGLLGTVLARDIIHIVQDLDKSREQHQSSEKTIKAVTDNVPGVVFQFKSNKDHDYTLDFVSTKSNEIFGLTPDPEDFFDRFCDRIPQEEKERYLNSVRESVDRGEPWTYEGRFIKPGGEEIWFSGNAIPAREGEFIVFNGLLMDISRRKEMESSMRMSKFIFDKAPMGIWRMGPSGEVLDVNDEGCKRLGYSREELLGKTVFDLAPGFTMSHWRESTKVLTDAGVKTTEAFHQSKKGEVFPIQVMENLVKFEKREFRVAFVQDITGRRRNEEELRRLRNYLSNIIDSMPSVLVGVDKEGAVTQWNHRAEEITGIRSEKACSQPLEKVFPGLEHEMGRIRTSISDCRVLRDPKVPRRNREETRYEDITIFPLKANGVEGAVIRMDDVTEQVRMEEMMIQSEKMLSVGGLAAGMAHEINNPLAGMMQTAQLMAQRLKSGSGIPANQKAAEAAGITMEAIGQYMENRGIPGMIEAIILSGQRVSEIVTNMLSFARKEDGAVSSHHLDEILDKTIELAATDYDLKKEYDFKRVEIVKEYDGDLPAVPCQASKIQQVVLNILTNGAQAMQGAGTPDARFTIRTYIDRGMACMEIEDNGPGMAEAVMKQIFDPFFTTKPEGLGTGLGLSVSYFIITENHKGEMSVESSPGAGAKFIVRLPLSMDGRES